MTLNLKKALQLKNIKMPFRFYFLMTSILIILIIPVNSCKKSDEVVPNVSVDIYMNISSTQFTKLAAIGGWEYITGGVKGIIVYRKSQDEFIALERNCTYKPSNGCRIQVEKSGVTAIDSCCMSKFLILDGSVLHSPATTPLKQYRTSFDGTTLHIYN
ncbi:MAG: hypothetical protein Q8880_00410 [Bacteroidota bacterium]|nr:hypothetical protein [Bacteroidota bacterium]